MSASRRWVVLAAVAAVLVLAVGWLLVVKPQNSKVSDLHTQTDAANAQNAQLLTQISALQSEQSQLPQEQLALQKFSTEIPDSAAEPTLVRQFTSAARTAGVDLVSISPGTATAVTAAAPAATGQTLSTAPASTEALDQLPISLAVVGSYANVEAFFNVLEKLPRALIVTQFTVCPEGTSTIGSPCSAPGEPGNKVPPPNSVGASLSTTVFFTPPTTAPAATGTQTLATAPTTPSTTAPTTAPLASSVPNNAASETS